MAKRRASRKSRSIALSAVLDDPGLPALVSSLPPRSLARMCREIGLQDAAAIMALAPVQQLIQALEASVWKSPRPGLPEVLDTRELIGWIATWLEIGSAFTAQRLAAVSDDDLALYLSQVLSVSTSAMWGFERSTETGDLDRIYAPSDDETAYGPYVVRARRDEDWETIRGILDAMASDAPERLLHLFAQLSADESMLAPDANRRGSNRDIAARRESTGERLGHVTAAGARALLAIGIQTRLEDLLSLREYDWETRRHLSALVSFEEFAPQDPRPAHHTTVPEPSSRTESNPSPGRTGELTRPDEAHLALLRASLEAVGLLETPPDRGLLTHEASRERLAIVKLV